MNKKAKIIKILYILPVILILALIFSGTTQASAAGRLGVSATKLWLNGQGQLKVTLDGRQDGEEITVTAKANNAVKIKIGKWKGDTCTIKLTPQKDKNTTLTITAGEESVSVKLYMLRERVRSSEEIYTYLKQAMVEIRCTDSRGAVYIGSGFFVGNGLVLTNHHVVEAASDIVITDYSGKEYPISKIWGSSAEKDLILFKVEGTAPVSLTLADKAVGGERIYNIGSPVGITGSFVTGIVANEGNYRDNTYYIQLSMPTGIGAGGGPIVNDRGQVLGVMTLVVSSAQNITLAVDCSEIRTFMGSLSKSDRMSLKSFYKTTADKVKDTNDFRIFEDFSDESTSKVYAGIEEELTPEEIYALAHEATVDIMIVYNSKGSMVTGSGFFIDENTIVTNQHVVDVPAMKQVTIRDYNGNEYILDGAIKTNAAYDVALLTVRPAVSGTSHGILEMHAGYIPAVGERVYGMGSPGGYSCTFSEGIVIMSTRSREGCDFINTSVPITSGSSGGPLLNKYGKVIGINSRVINVVNNSNLSVLIGYISKVA